MDETSASNRAKPNPWMVSTLILLGIVVGFGVSQIPYLKNKTAPANTLAPSVPSQQQAQKEPPATVLTDEQVTKLPDDDPFFGDANAPVTVVEFSDFQCPYCGRFFSATLPSIEENYIKTGKVRLVYRDFPLDFHAQAMPAANAAQCANDQGKFKEMHDKIFNEQQQWASNPKANDMFKGYAKALGLDAKEFNSCFDGQKHAEEIRKDLIDGATVGVNGTPGFFINGKAVSGAMPYELIFKPIFEAELAGKEWEIEYDSVGRPTGVKAE